MFKQIRNLESGELVDLTPVLEKHFPELAIPADISNFEYAIVEELEDFGAFVVLYTDQHNLSLPPFVQVEVFDPLADEKISPDSEYHDTNVGGY